MNLIGKSTITAMLLLAVFGSTTPAASQISVRSPLSDDRIVQPGSSYEGAILIRNETAELQEVKVYQTDYSFHGDGTNEYGEPGSASRSNASWIQFAPHHLTIPPGETVPVHYEVAVPKNESGELHGTYWSMLMVEAIPRESPESTLSEQEEEQRYGVRQIMRYGIQVATHLPDNETAQLDIDDPGLISDPTVGPTLEFTVENQGSSLLQPDVWIDLYDVDGNSFGRVDGSRNRIYPDTSVRQRIALGSLERGTYKAMVFVDAAEGGVFGAEYDLDIEAE